MSEPVSESPVVVERATLGTLIRLAWPIVVSRSTQVVVGLGDSLMVAGLGKNALAATGTGAINTMVLCILPMGICFMVGSFASQYFGRRDLAGARRYGFYGLALSGATQVFCLLAIPFIGPVLGLFDFAPEVRAMMTTYLALRLLSGGAIVGMEALASYYGGVNNTVLPMRLNVVAMVLDVFLNYAMIGGNFGFPKLGVAGAAISSSISTWIAFSILLYMFLRRTNGVRIPKLHLAELWRLIRFGFPSGVNWFLEFFAFNVFINVVVAGLGTTALAAMMTVLNINSVAFMPAFGIASAGAILVGQHIGAGKKDEVPRLVKLTFFVAAGWQATAGFFYLVLPVLLFTPFARGDEQVDRELLLAMGSRMLMLSAAWQVFDATANTLAESLRAAGDTTFPMWVRVSIAWLFFTPGAWISVRWLGGGDVAAMLWLVAYLALLAGILLLRFRSGAWRRIELVEEPLV